jgi:hypothetical protein
VGGDIPKAKNRWKGLNSFPPVLAKFVDDELDEEKPKPI